MRAPRPLLIVGAGGLAREALVAIRAGSSRYRLLGALDDDVSRHGTALDGLAVIGGSEVVHDNPDAAVLVCVANPSRPGARAALVRRLGLTADRLATVIHPGASVPAGSEIGPGAILLAGVVLTTSQRVGPLVVAMPQVLLTHDDEIAEGVTLAGRVALAGRVRVCRDAYLGQGALVRENVTIGSGAVVGMGSVVLHDVPAGEVWAGVPATRIGRDRPGDTTERGRT